MASTKLMGWWYATGPADHPYTSGDPAWNVHRVVAEPMDTPAVVLVENVGGCRFWVPRELVEQIASP